MLCSYCCSKWNAWKAYWLLSQWSCEASVYQVLLEYITLDVSFVLRCGNFVLDSFSWIEQLKDCLIIVLFSNVISSWALSASLSLHKGLRLVYLIMLNLLARSWGDKTAMLKLPLVAHPLLLTQFRNYIIIRTIRPCIILKILSLWLPEARGS